MTTKKEYVNESPLRALDAATGGELGFGELGVLVARHGAGKSSMLVGIALDRILRGRKVVHVSLDTKVDHVRDYYEEIFAEMMRAADVEEPGKLHVEMERSRHIHAYLGGSFTAKKLKEAILFLKEHASFSPDVLLIDDFTHATVAEIEEVKELAGEQRAELWLTAVRHRDEKVSDPDDVPPPVDAYKELARVIVDLRTSDGGVRLRVLRPRPESGDGELPFVLDPTTMLLKKS